MTTSESGSTSSSSEGRSLTHYETLGVSQKSTYEEIKASFSKLARRSHPDKNGGAESPEFKRIQQAWERLRETEQRRCYDEDLWQIALNLQAKRGGVLPIDRKDFETAQDEDTGETIFVYDCRCGEEIILDNPTKGKGMECPGCCFVYQLNG